MAQPTYEYSGVCYTATSGQTVFPLTSTTGNPIGYLSPTHIHVRTSTDSGETWSILPADTGWTFADPATSIVLVTPATVGEWVDIQRKTPIDTDWVDFQSGSLLTAGQLNEAETFSLYCDQEIVDGIRGGGSGGGIPEAPDDGKQYGRQSESWTEIINSGGGGMVYKGTTDVTGAAPSGPKSGDLWVNTTTGTASNSWTGLGGDAVAEGDRVVYNGSVWELIPSPSIGGYLPLTGGELTGPLTSTSTATFTGDVTADSFIGNGSGLTNLPAPATSDLQAVTDAGNTTTNGATFAGAVTFDVVNGGPNFAITAINASAPNTFGTIYARNNGDAGAACYQAVDSAGDVRASINNDGAASFATISATTFNIDALPALT